MKKGSVTHAPYKTLHTDLNRIDSKKSEGKDTDLLAYWFIKVMGMSRGFLQIKKYTFRVYDLCGFHENFLTQLHLPLELQRTKTVRDS